MATLPDMIAYMQIRVENHASVKISDVAKEMDCAILETLQWMQRHEADIRIIAKVKKETDSRLVDPDQSGEPYGDDRDPE